MASREQRLVGCESHTSAKGDALGFILWCTSGVNENVVFELTHFPAIRHLLWRLNSQLPFRWWPLLYQWQAWRFRCLAIRVIEANFEHGAR